jgi:hypothetical protein
MCRQLLGEDSVSKTPDHAYVVMENGVPTIRFAFSSLHFPDENASARKRNDNPDGVDSDDDDEADNTEDDE